ncbi:DNA polymerase III subunit gamma/tau [Parerythrobacter jejuensis]|uniref:DNA polymerase III subunit gamma/tau n=1 Tax=Parerythrobacter jejuensis TaxID=795812 RepID=A0A845AS70_9SPHN|nr:DNA polymerase III subunit gamma/tau [Parerythrobacter jejuensis]MXP32023.1 DNA polymerase III subunit gamma/tau [Parerythrobacter jejuensis]
MGDSPENTDAPPWDGGEEPEQAPSATELEAAGQSAMFGDTDTTAPVEASKAEEQAPAEKAVGQPAAPVADEAQPYRVLARKYRPQTFSQLIGQEPMVRTLGNAIERDRLAHAFLMTGVRGVGKTSTARLIAKALNCIGTDGQGGPTIDPCGRCEPCVAIAEGRHIDVIEMDAASHTGVDDVREIIEAVRYAAVSARFKIYIIDEVHMLSRNAFNALLKTLEEPPAHVKFLFATTEVDKLPVTVLSRTQRFDLRRIPAELLQSHFGWVCGEEGVAAEDEALAMIAAAAEGSVRDGLSILDQAIAHADLDSESKVTAARVRDMLGLADKGAQRRLLGTILEGDAKALLVAIADQYSLGVEPLALIRSQMEIVHRITLAQVGSDVPGTISEEERSALSDWAGRLSAGQLHRLWQLLLKAYDEVKTAPDPLVSAQMGLLRMLHAADLPDPGKLAKKLEDMQSAGPVVAAAAPAADSPANASQATSFADLISQVQDAGHDLAASIMQLQLRVISCEPGRLVYARGTEYSDDIGPYLREGLLAATGNRWQIEQRDDPDAPPSMVELANQQAVAARAEIELHPMVAAAKAAFPGAELLTEEDAGDPRPQWSKRA